MYAAVLISSKGEAVSVTIDMQSSFRKLRSFIKQGVKSGKLKEMLTEIELDGYDPRFVDQIIITSTSKDKPGHTRMSVNI